MLTEEEHREELEEFLSGEESLRIRLLWEIFFETEIRDVDRLEEQIYQYGTLVKTEDYLGRELFVGMVFLLNKLKAKEKEAVE